MDAPRFPTWRDIGIPQLLPASIKKLRFGNLLNFLVQDRVFLVKNEVIYTYLCASCGYQKHNLTIFDNYSECQRCYSNALSALPHWNINSKNSRPFREDSLIDLCSIMDTYHCMYVKQYCSDTYEMRLNKNNGTFTACFMGGDPVDGTSPVIATVRAALCCPFLWDDSFDFKEGKFKDRSSSHLSHMIYQICGRSEC